MSQSQLERSRELILDVKHAQMMLSAALEEQENAELLLLEAQSRHQVLTAYLRQNTTLTDVLQIQLEKMREEKKNLVSNTTRIRERLF